MKGKDRRGEKKRRGGGKKAKPTLVGLMLSSHLFCHVMLFKNTVYKFPCIYCKWLHNVGTVGLYVHTHKHTHSRRITSLWKRLCSLRPCLAPLLPDSSTSIFSGFSSSKASSFSITPERLHRQHTDTHTQ